MDMDPHDEGPPVDMAPEPEKERENDFPALPSAADMIPWQPKGYSTFSILQQRNGKVRPISSNSPRRLKIEHHLQIDAAV